MKKIVMLILLLAVPIKVLARSDTITVTLNKCIDGDTASFNYNEEIYKVRFLAINTKELKNKDKYATIAADYTCDMLSNAKEIKLKFDKGSDELDKYNRYLAWIFVDDSLLQKDLVKKGYAEVKYIYGDYEYTDELKTIEKQAKQEHLGIWSDYQEETNYSIYIIYIIIIIIGLILGLSSTKIKKIIKVINKSIK